MSAAATSSSDGEHLAAGSHATDAAKQPHLPPTLPEPIIKCSRLSSPPQHGLAKSTQRATIRAPVTKQEEHEHLKTGNVLSPSMYMQDNEETQPAAPTPASDVSQLAIKDDDIQHPDVLMPDVSQGTGAAMLENILETVSSSAAADAPC